MDEGRLDLLEYDTRLARAYSAVTYGDLDQLFTDLPDQAARTTAPMARRSPDVPAVRVPASAPLQGVVARMPTALKILWTVWLAVLSINLTVWLLVSISSGEPVYFWPMWLLVPGAPLPGVTVAVLTMPRNRAERQPVPPLHGPGAPALD
jgi:hypothetical protein